MKVVLATIDHEKQRYPTVGDWIFDENGNLHIRVSKLPATEMEICVMVHELIEAVLCKHRGIKEEDVTAFDVEYEKERPEGCTSEPGDDPNAPYFKEHQFATAIEMQLAQELNLNWGAYEETVNSL